MAANIPTYGLNDNTVTARNAEYAISGQFTGGANLAASCAPGIGINTGSKSPKLEDWTVLDQYEAARDPQSSQHIGGDGLGDGDQTFHSLNAVQGIDINDQLAFITAAAQAAPGVGFGAGNSDPINRTSETIEIGENAWGTNTV